MKMSKGTFVNFFLSSVLLWNEKDTNLVIPYQTSGHIKKFLKKDTEIDRSDLKT